MKKISTLIEVKFLETCVESSVNNGGRHKLRYFRPVA